MPGPIQTPESDTEATESFCFAVLNPKRCSIDKKGNPHLAYDCRAVSNEGKSAEDTVLVSIFITDSEGARRRKACLTIAAHFSNSNQELNVSQSTVIFG